MSAIGAIMSMCSILKQLSNTNKNKFCKDKWKKNGMDLVNLAKYYTFL